MTIDLKFVELTADVLEIFFIKKIKSRYISKGYSSPATWSIDHSRSFRLGSCLPGQS